ncbi:MAG: hypothetical protein ACO3SO_10575 [Luteolibacter sp.]
MKSTLLITTLFSCLAIGSQAATVIPITDVFGHNERSNFAGTITDMIIGSGMNGYGVDGNVGWPSGEGDPTTWSATNDSYGNEWQSQGILDSGTSINGKIGWAVFDLGTVTSNLENIYLWNVRENNARAVNEYNIYYASSPGLAVPHGPTGGSSNTDYDFSGSGWTKVNGSTLNMSWRNTDGAAYNDVVSLGGTSARYIAIEIISNGVGTTGDATRTGLAEVAITQIPEPSVALLSGLGVLMLLRRKKH